MAYKIVSLSVVLVSAQNQETCEDLDELITNVNPALLTNCSRDSNCTQVTCQTNGQLEDFFASMNLMLIPCEIPPGVVIVIFDDDGAVLHQASIVYSAVLGANNRLLGTVALHVLIQSTASLLEITVRIFFLLTRNPYRWLCMSYK